MECFPNVARRLMFSQNYLEETILSTHTRKEMCNAEIEFWCKD